MSAFGIEPRVDVVVGGVQKGGTTALDQALRGHPGLRMPSVKEPHWFDEDSHFEHGAPDYAPYHALWGAGLSAGLCCDSTPSYLWWPGAAARLRDYNPDLRWVVLLRDPAARAYSHWNMQRTRGNETLDFGASLDAEAIRLATASPRDRRRYSYLSRGYYAQQLARLFELFPREQVLVLRSDRLRDAFPATVGAVLEFLGLEPLAELESLSAHEGSYDEPLTPQDRARLVALYDADIRALEAMLGWDLAAWRR
jgi:hypothetical protein